MNKLNPEKLKHSKYLSDRVIYSMFFGGVNKVPKKKFYATLIGIVLGSFIFTTQLAGYEIGRRYILSGKSPSEAEIQMKEDFPTSTFRVCTSPGRNLAYWLHYTGDK